MHRIGIIVAALALSACAATPPAETAERRDCFRSSSVNGYTVIDDHNVGLRVSANQNYILTTTWNVRDLDWTQQVAIRSDNGWICTGNGLRVELIGGEPRQTYPVTSITRAPDNNQGA